VTTPRLRVEHPTNATVIALADPADRNRLDDGMVDALHAALDAASPQQLLVFRGGAVGSNEKLRQNLSSGGGVKRLQQHHCIDLAPQ